MTSSARKGEFPHHAVTNGIDALSSGVTLMEQLPNLTELTAAEHTQLKTAINHLRAAHTIIDAIAAGRSARQH